MVSSSKQLDKLSKSTVQWFQPRGSDSFSTAVTWLGPRKLLGRPHVTTGEVEHGLKIGQDNRFSNGQHRARLRGLSSGRWRLCRLDARRRRRRCRPLSRSASTKPFRRCLRLAEAFVLDRKDLDLYGKAVDLEYVGFVRPAAKFNGVEDLVISINNDIAKIRVLLGIGAGN
jgi:riboflavin kinase / FMN adenylyltransferase